MARVPCVLSPDARRSAGYAVDTAVQPDEIAPGSPAALLPIYWATPWEAETVQRTATGATVEPEKPCILRGCIMKANSCTRLAARSSSFRFSSR